MRAYVASWKMVSHPFMYVFTSCHMCACVYTREPYGRMCPQSAQFPFNGKVKSFLVARFYKLMLLQSICDGTLEVNRP